MAEEPLTLASYLRSLRWQVPLGVAAVLVMYALDVRGVRNLGLAGTVLVGLGFVVVLGPLAWLRWQHWGRNDRAAWLALLGAVAWVVVCLVTLVVVLDLTAPG